MRFVSISPARAGGSWSALMVLVMAVQAVTYGASEEGLSPNTKFSSFKPTTAAYTSDLSKLPVRTSLTNYLTGCRQPVTPFNQAKANNLQATLRSILQVNAGTKLKHVAGLNLFSQMSFTDRARYLGLRRRTRSSSSNDTVSTQTLLDDAEFLRRTARINLASAEAAAERFFAAAEEARAASRSTVAQEDDTDWTTHLPVIKNQGGCGACWAFATAAVAEAASSLKTGTVVSLSEKQLVDCNRENLGCEGGTFAPAFSYIIKNGLTSSSLFPYVAQPSSCPARVPDVVSRLSSYTPLPVNNEAAMLEALKKGPIAVAVTADTPFQFYVGGVFTSDTCSGKVNHAVVIVGAGRDEELGVDYWLVRNSWGESWGEGGYMRIARSTVSGPGMCNIATEPYQASSNDVAPPPPGPAPGPDTGCEDQIITVNSDANLADIAEEYKTTVARIQLDNGLSDPMTKLEDGTQLTISCPSGIWSEVYGVWGLNVANAMVAAPVEGTCPEGHYAQRFYIKPSQWYTSGAWTGSTYVGQITMICTDDTEITIDAQPGFDPGWEDGSVAQPSGFPSISMMTGSAIDSVFGVGAQTGGERNFACPDGMVVTGIAAGASPEQYPKGWISNLQFRCSNPFGTDTLAKKRVTNLLKSAFPKVPFGLSCRTHIAGATDTWQNVASKYRVLVNELIRSNGQMAGRVVSGKPVFIPPCIDGVIQGTKKPGARAASAIAIDQKLSLKEAGASAQPMNTEALVAEMTAVRPAAAAEPTAAAEGN